MATRSRSGTSTTTRTTASDGKADRLRGAFDEAAEQRRQQALEAKLKGLARVEAENRELRARCDRLQSALDLTQQPDALVTTPPAWLAKPAGKGRLHHAIPTLFLSDLHLDETVRPAEVEFANAFNRRIARARLKRTFERAVSLARDYYRGLTYDGCVVLLGGDLFSGTIHEELAETNEDTILGSLDYWSEHLGALLLGLAEHFGAVHVWGVVGNHGRRSMKPRAKLRVRDNFDWLLYRMLARATAGKATWTIPESADADFTIYDTRYRLTHGDQFRGGSGIAGMLSGRLLGQHRKSEQQMALGKGFDWLVMGHWHRYLHGVGLIVNGSLKGYDEYAYVSNFKPERAQQAFWLTTPEHGAAFASPIFCDDRASERWEDVA